jgi:hypothetical protein
MKQALIYSLKIWLISTLIAIIVSGLLCYEMNHKTFDAFGVSYTFLIQQFTYLWTWLLTGSIILWLITGRLVQLINNKNWTSFTKRIFAFIIVEMLTTSLLVIIRLLINYDHFISGVLLWFILIAITISILCIGQGLNKNIEINRNPNPF